MRREPRYRRKSTKYWRNRHEKQLVWVHSVLRRRQGQDDSGRGLWRCGTAGAAARSAFANSFLKDGTSGERRAPAKLGVTVLAANPVGKFSFRMTEEEKAETAAALGRTFDAATGFAVRERATLLAPSMSILRAR